MIHWSSMLAQLNELMLRMESEFNVLIEQGWTRALYSSLVAVAKGAL